jgi:hypothetical protein
VYAVEGLGFFQIPHTTNHQQKNDPRTAIIQVIDGALIISNMISELERLIPTKWSRKVENIGHNTFRTVIPNKTQNFSVWWSGGGSAVQIQQCQAENW